MKYKLKEQIYLYAIIGAAVLLFTDTGNTETTTNQRLILSLILLLTNINRDTELNFLDGLVITFFLTALVTNILFKNSPFLTLHTLSPILFIFLYINLKALYLKTEKDDIVVIILQGCYLTVILLNILYLLSFNRGIFNNPIPFTNTSLMSNFLGATTCCLICVNSRTSYTMIYPIAYALINKGRIAILLFAILISSKVNFNIYIKICTIFALLTLLFFVKMESSIGRLLIIKTSINQINTVIIKPIGFGEFANWYLPHQSKYLNKIEKINSDFLLADNSEFAFNDFLQVFIEMGFIGLGIFIAIFILAFKYNSYFKPKYNFRNFLWYYILISCFCYILYVDLFKFIFISIIAYISSHQNKSILRIQSNKMILFKCILIPLIIFNLFWHYNPNFRLHEKSTRLIIHPEHNVYDEAYKLYTKQKYNDAIYLLSNIELCSFDMDLLLLKAKCYEEIFDVINAQNYYIKAYELFPNKFKPKYHLFQFLKSKQFDARSIAKDILDTPIKIDNRETQSLRKEAIEYLNNNGTNSINVEHPIG